MLSQWLWIMVCYDGPVCGNGESLVWIMLSQYLWIMVSYAEPVVVNHGVYDEPVVVNHGVLCWASCFESCCVILSQWLWIMMSYAEPVVVNDGVLFWASGCESWCVILSHWLWIMVNYAGPVGVNLMVSYGVLNHGVLYAGCQVCYSEFVKHSELRSQWLWIMVCYDGPLVMLSQLLWIMVSNTVPVWLWWASESWAICCESCCYAEPVVVNQYGCESWWAMLS